MLIQQGIVYHARRHIYSLLCLWLSCLALSSQAATSVWKVSKGNNYFYLAGTMHVLKADDYPLPAEFEQAYKDASHVVLEVDLSKQDMGKFQQRLAAKNFYGEGRNLKDTITPAAWKALHDYCDSRGLRAEHFIDMPVGIVITTIAMAEMMQLDIDQQGVDAYFLDKAVKDKKTIEGLETMDQQIDFLFSMGKGDESNFILQNLEELSQLPEQVDLLRKAWRAGDMAAIDTLMIKDMKEKYPDVYQQLLYQRNLNWLPQLQALTDSKEVEYVLVGAAHIAGKDGLKALLKEKGYTVQRLKK